MSATVTSITKAGSYAWRYDYSGTSPFDIYYNGEVIASQTTDTAIILNHTDAYEPPALEIIDADDTDTPESVRYSPLFIGQFRGDPDMSYYLVEQYVDAAWTQIAQIPEDGLGGYRKFQSTALADVTTHSFRVTPYDADDNAGYPLQYDIFMIRNPEPPSVTVTYAAGTITIAARA